MFIWNTQSGIVFLLVTVTNIGYSVKAKSNPCDQTKAFPERLFGSRNEKCPSQNASVCDSNLTANWYKISDGLLLTHCPRGGDCGVASQAWLNGTLPDETQADINMTVCIRQGQNCCAQTVAVRVKYCKSTVYDFD